MSEPSLVLPGQSLGQKKTSSPGPGTHIQGSQICASVAGTLISTPSSGKKSKSTLLSVSQQSVPVLPDVNTIVLGKITRAGPRQATLSIHALQPTIASTPYTLNEPLPAVIRQQDIRLTETDKVKVGESFCVGDVVRAVVISLGDERSYYCSTAKNELGVIMATSKNGNTMVPVSWLEFMDPITGLRESRKVAKVV